MFAMNKTEAIHQLGGSIAAAAKAIGVTYQAVNQWPEVLPRRIVDRVEAALWRAHRASEPRRKARPLPAQPKEAA
jgi:transcriptional repressor of cell division inhibition gene dicB